MRDSFRGNCFSRRLLHHGAGCRCPRSGDVSNFSYFYISNHVIGSTNDWRGQGACVGYLRSDIPSAAHLSKYIVRAARTAMYVLPSGTTTISCTWRTSSLGARRECEKGVQMLRDNGQDTRPSRSARSNGAGCRPGYSLLHHVRIITRGGSHVSTAPVRAPKERRRRAGWQSSRRCRRLLVPLALRRC